MFGCSKDDKAVKHPWFIHTFKLTTLYHFYTYTQVDLQKTMAIIYLVGGLEHGFYFSIYILGISSSQLTKSYFSEGRAQPPTTLGGFPTASPEIGAALLEHDFSRALRLGPSVLMRFMLVGL